MDVCGQAVGGGKQTNKQTKKPTPTYPKPKKRRGLFGLAAPRAHGVGRRQARALRRPPQQPVAGEVSRGGRARRSASVQKGCGEGAGLGAEGAEEGGVAAGKPGWKRPLLSGKERGLLPGVNARCSLAAPEAVSEPPYAVIARDSCG